MRSRVFARSAVSALIAGITSPYFALRAASASIHFTKSFSIRSLSERSPPLTMPWRTPLFFVRPLLRPRIVCATRSAVSLSSLPSFSRIAIRSVERLIERGRLHSTVSLTSSYGFRRAVRPG